MARPIVLIHGYSADSHDFSAFSKGLQARNINAKDINICDYVSLSNEVTVKDIAEGLDRALLNQAGLKNGETFDAIVHSTGMLVIRCWLTAYGQEVDRERIKRLKHLVGVAPATWGSPQAHKGRTFLGALVKGNRNLGPDFMEAGDRILDALELGSRFTWDLAHADLLGAKPSFDTGANTPWVAVYIGDQPYDGVPSVANDPGTDGTVRWAGCGLNTRKITVDLTKEKQEERFSFSDWAISKKVTRQDVPIMPVPGKNHGTIVQEPDKAMMDHIVKFLQLDTQAAFDVWQQEWPTETFNKIKKARTGDSGNLAAKLLSLIKPAASAQIDGWQQFIVYAKDERGDSIRDYMIEVEASDDGNKWHLMDQMYQNVHPYKGDPGLRCFHIRLGQGLSARNFQIRVKITADTGTEMVGYLGFDSQSDQARTMGRSDMIRKDGPRPFVLEFNNQLPTGGTFFFPFTTTLVEIKLNREPLLNSKPPIVSLKSIS